MSDIYRWARHPEAIEDLRERAGSIVIHQAVAWAYSQQERGADELTDALAGLFQGRGWVGGSDANRAIEIILDAYLEHHAEETRHARNHTQAG